MLCLKNFMEEAESKMPEATKLRKRWLFFTICLLLLPDCFKITKLFIGIHLLDLSLFAKQLIVLLNPIRFFIYLWIMYHCVYKMRGTKWLAFNLISYALFFFLNLMVLKAASFMQYNHQAFFTCYIIHVVIYSCIFITWYNLSFKMLRLNRSLQKRWKVALVQENKSKYIANEKNKPKYIAAKVRCFE